MEINTKSKKEYKVVHFVGGRKHSGAYKGAEMLHNDLVDKNINSQIMHEDNNSLSKKINMELRINFEKIPKLLFPNRQKNTSFSSSIVGYNFLNNKKYINSDIVHLHWINNGFFNISYIQKINKPIIWTIRDMWPFTGGCHYSLGCNKFEEICNMCPQLNSNFNYDLSTFNQNRKKKYFQKKKIIFIVNSNWMRKMAEKSLVLNNQKFYTFFPSFDLKNYYFDKNQKFKEKLNINTKKKLLLYGAQNIEASYKGFKYFLESLDYIDKNKYFLIFFGNFWNENEIKKKNFEFKNLGFINDLNFQRKLYSISDLFVATSIQEGFPKTVAESLLCETPVVYFKDTAIEDVCEHKLIGGYGADYCNSRDLAKGIDWIVESQNNPKMLAKKGAEKIKKNFNSDLLIEKYIKLYENLINL